MRVWLARLMYCYEHGRLMILIVLSPIQVLPSKCTCTLHACSGTPYNSHDYYYLKLTAPTEIILVYLWWYIIVWCATKGVRCISITESFFTESQINQFHMSISIQCYTVQLNNRHNDVLILLFLQ